MRNDRLACLTELLVGTGLLGVPVRIEDRLNRTASRQAGDRFHQRSGGAGRCAINEEDTLGAGARKNITFSGNADDEQIVAQSDNARGFGYGLRRGRNQASNRRAQSEPRGADRPF